MIIHLIKISQSPLKRITKIPLETENGIATLKVREIRSKRIKKAGLQISL